MLESTFPSATSGQDEELSRMANRAQNLGYNKIQDYINDFQSTTFERRGLEREAKEYETALDQAKGAYSIDEFAYKNDMTKWSPEVSQILRELSA